MLRAMTTLFNDAPRAAMIEIARMSGGKAIMASMTRWTIRSVTPPKWTLVTPIIMPTLAPMNALSSPA